MFLSLPLGLPSIYAGNVTRLPGADRPDEFENACTGGLPDELLAPTCAGSVDPRQHPAREELGDDEEELDQDPIDADSS